MTIPVIFCNQPQADSAYRPRNALEAAFQIDPSLRTNHEVRRIYKHACADWKAAFQVRGEA